MGPRCSVMRGKAFGREPRGADGTTGDGQWNCWQRNGDGKPFCLHSFASIPLPNPFRARGQIQVGHEAVDCPPLPLTCRKPGAGKRRGFGAVVLGRRKGGRWWTLASFLRLRGFRIGFYGSEPDEPAHVPVHKAGHEAKFWLGPVRLSWNKGFRESDLRDIARILAANETKLIEAWNETG